MLTPVLTLVVWTMVMWIWLYATRFPAMAQAKLNASKVTRDDMVALPKWATNVADNYNHLHEQPTLFYALSFYTQLAGTNDSLNINLAWGYVVLRVLHSLVQGTFNYVPARFLLFSLGSITLMVLAARNVLAL